MSCYSYILSVSVCSTEIPSGHLSQRDCQNPHNHFTVNGAFVFRISFYYYFHSYTNNNHHHHHLLCHCFSVFFSLILLLLCNKAQLFHSISVYKYLYYSNIFNCGAGFVWWYYNSLSVCQSVCVYFWRSKNVFLTIFTHIFPISATRLCNNAALFLSENGMHDFHLNEITSEKNCFFCFFAQRQTQWILVYAFSFSRFNFSVRARFGS